MRIRIHRGAHEIGGNCIEVAADDGRRLVLDVGRPLSAGWDEVVGLPEVSGFATPDPSLLGVVISHPHLDHYGLVSQVAEKVPIYIGKEAAALLNAARFFSPVSGGFDPVGHLQHAQELTVGPFTITPHLNDHSAYDAYSLLIEADGRRLFYTGDIRAHGRKHKMFKALVKRPPADVNVLMMEGTHVRVGGAHDEATFETESKLEKRFVKLAKETEGAIVTFGSMQNIDRLVTVYRAAKRSGRVLIMDLYGATVAAATRSSIPQPGFKGLRVYVPLLQRIKVKEAAEFWRVQDIASCRVFPEELAADPGRFVFHVPSSTARELLKSEVLDASGVAVWSLWEGYRSTPSGKALEKLLGDYGVKLVSLHTSGHASVPDLKKLVEAVDPDRVVPIHSEATDRFAELFPRVEPHTDRAWWAV